MADAQQCLQDAAGPDLGPEAIAALEAHPDFPAVVRSAATSAVNTYQGRWLLNRLLNDRGRFVASLMILSLHFSEGEGRGFTAAQLKRAALAANLCSSGRITAFLATLRLSGFLTPVQNADRRTNLLAPTEALIDIHRSRWSVVFKLLATLSPEAQGATDALRDPAFVGHCAQILVRAYQSGGQMFIYVPEMRPFADRDAGITMLLSMLIQREGQAISVTGMARRFSVSRSHALETLRLAEQAGLVVVTAQRGCYVAGPRLGSTMQRFFCMLFLVYLSAFRQARAKGWDVG